MKPTVNVFLDKRTTLKSDKHPLKLSVTADRKNRSWSFGFAFTIDEYEKLVKNQRKAPYKDVWNEIQAHLGRAERVINEMMPFFNFSDFKNRFFAVTSTKVTSDRASLIYVQDFICAEYMSKEQYSMTVKIKDSVNSLLKFFKKDNVPMSSITPSLCRRYEDFMFSKSKTQSRNGAGINLRHIRILFNTAIANEFISREIYPFKRGPGERSEFTDAYVIPCQRKVKKYLNADQLITLSENDSFKTQSQEKAHAAFLISYYCNGANPADFLRFKFKDIDGDHITFYRQKIKNASRKDMKNVKIFITPELRGLIERYGNPPLKENYIFNCYDDGMSEVDMYRARKQFCSRASNPHCSFLVVNEKFQFIFG